MTFQIPGDFGPLADIIEDHQWLLYHSLAGRNRGFGPWVKVPARFVPSMRELAQKDLAEWSGVNEAIYRPRSSGVPLFFEWLDCRMH